MNETFHIIVGIVTLRKMCFIASPSLVMISVTWFHTHQPKKGENLIILLSKMKQKFHRNSKIPLTGPLIWRMKMHTQASKKLLTNKIRSLLSC